MEGSSLSEKAARALFAAVQQAEEDEGAQTGGASELVYSEFVEALAAAACFKCCNPYLPLDQRCAQAASCRRRRIPDKIVAQAGYVHPRRGASTCQSYQQS